MRQRTAIASLVLSPGSGFRSCLEGAVADEILTFMPTEIVYVELLHEGVDVWAPVEAERIGGDTYLLPSVAPEDQEWAFPPGSRVLCERRGHELIALRLAD